MKYTGPIKLVILDIAGTVCDGPQDLSHLFPNDDGLAVKGPVIVLNILTTDNLDAGNPDNIPYARSERIGHHGLLP